MIYISKESLRPEITSKLKKFINSRVGFLLDRSKYSKEVLEKKIHKINEFIHIFTAQPDNLDSNIYSLTSAANYEAV